MDLIDSLDRAFLHAHGVIAGVRADQYDNATPCDKWTVGDLLEHMIGVVAGTASAVAGEAPSDAFELGTDPAAQFEQRATAARAAWGAPDALERVVDAGAGPMPGRVLASITLLDAATHTWDLATATGQPARLPQDVAEAALEASLATITPEIRPGRFAAEISVPDEAGTTERLVAFLGRDPHAGS